MLSNLILRGSRPVVSPGGGLSFASKFCESPRLIVCCGSLRTLGLVPVGSTARADGAAAGAPGAEVSLESRERESQVLHQSHTRGKTANSGRDTRRDDEPRSLREP